MNRPPPLTLAFLEVQPRSAARVMEDIAPDHGAAFLETVPARIAAPVVAMMMPWSAARCLEPMEPAAAAGLLRDMAPQDGTTLLRLMAKDRRDLLLDELPKGMAKAFVSSLTYPGGSVGAWMDHTVPVFPMDATVSDALKFVRRARRRKDSHVFLVDARRKFIGTVAVSDLLRHDEKTALRELMDASVEPLSNRAMLATVENLADWDEFPMLPVIGRKGNVLGGLARRSLRKGSAKAKEGAGFAPGAILSILIVAYLVVFSGLVRLTAQTTGPTNRVSSRENDRGRRRNKSD